MAKQLNVDMRFNAQTAEASAGIKDLQNQLDKLSRITTSTNGFGLTASIKEAVAAAAQLKVQLDGAMNANTGQLDLSKFNESLKKSGMTLSNYETQLSKLGPEGTKAFATLAQSIATAEIPLKRSNAMLNEFFTTLKNTARWQISSSILHGFMGTLSSAKMYAQDLNESLNNIRIVTGHSTDQMARFAAEANKAARELSTTTTAYTDASLIFYQQGLNDEEVAARTEVTIKMANAAGESAQKVSDQLTAVWNNFYDGSESLEYYADVMTALGAATASSTDEIAAGIEKFASVANAIGLSYDYAASALATVTATTRQSADVVGTAFKTLFSRMQGLKLGETLEDGTDLTKYSAALKTVGVDIKTANGDLRDMNDILDDLGGKWQLLTRDQKVATAQTVAGVRQYNQLMALMENWDFFQENLTVAQGSEGTLTKQANIYAEGWEAARDRVKASAEAIYNSLINDDFFIGINNMVSSLLDSVNLLIKGFGGLPGVITLLGTALTTTFGSQLSSSIDNMLENIKLKTALGRQEIINLKQEANKKLIDLTADTSTTSGRIANMAYTSQSNAQTAVLEKQLDTRVRMSATEEKIAQGLLEQHSALVQNTIEQGKQLELAEKSYTQTQRQVETELRKNISEKMAGAKDLADAGLTTHQIRVDVTPGANNEAVFDQIRASLRMTEEAASDAGQSFKEYASINFGGGIGQELEALRVALSKTNVDAFEVNRALNALAQIRGPQQAITDYQTMSARLERLASQQAQLSTINNAFSKIKFDSKDIDSYKAKIASIKQEVADSGKTLEQTFGHSGAKALKAFDAALNSTSGVSEETFNKLKGDLSAALDEMSATSEAQLNKIANLLRGALGDQAGPIIDQIRQKFNELTDSEQRVAEGTEALQNSGETIKQYLNTVKGDATTLGQALVGIGSAAMSLATIFNSLKGVVDIWNDDDASLMQKITTSMTALGTVTFAASRAYQALHDIKLKDLAAMPKHISDLIIAAAQEKLAAKAKLEKAGASAAATAAETAEAAANMAEGATAGAAAAPTLTLAGALWALLAPILPIVIAIGALTAGIGILVSLDKKHRKEVHETAVAAREEADALRESAEATKEQADEYESALKKYEAAKKAFEEGSGSVEDLKTAQSELNDIAKKLTTTLDVQGLSLAQLTGDYDDLTKAIRGATQEQLKAAESKLTTAQYETGNEFITSMYEGRGYRDAGTYYAGFGAHPIETGKLNDYLTGEEKYLQDYGTNLGVYVSDYKNLDQMMAAYEEVQAFYQKVVNTGDMSLLQTDTMKNIHEWLDKSAQYYDLYVQYGDQIKAIQLEITSLNQDIASTLNSVQTQEEYATAREKLIQALAEERGITQEDAEGWAALEEEVDAYLGTLENTAPYATAEKAMDELATKTGKTRKEIEEFRKELEQLGLIDFQWAPDYATGTTEEDWKIQAAHAQANSQLTDIGSQREAVQSGIDLLGTKGVSAQDIAAWAQSFDFDAFNEVMRTNLDWKQFISLTDEDRDALLTSYQHALDAVEVATMESIAQQDAQVIAQYDATVQELLSVRAAAEAQLGLPGDDNGASFEGLTEGLRELLTLHEQESSLTEEQRERLTELTEQYQAYIDAAGGYEQLEEQVRGYEELNGKIEAYKNFIAELTAEMEAYNAASKLAILNAQNLGELWLMSDAAEDAEAYALGLAHLAQQYESCTDELRDFNRAMQNGTDAQREAATSVLETSVRCAELAEQYDMSADEIEAYAKQFKELMQYQNATSKALAEMAKDQLRFDDAVESSIKNYDDWLEELKMGEEGALVSADTLNELADAYGDLLDIDPSLFSSGFLRSTENIELMRQALEGDEEAYQKLLSIMNEEIRAKVGLDDEDYYNGLSALEAAAQEFYNCGFADIEAGASLDNSAFLDALTQMINATQMTVDEATSLLASMGVDAEIVSEPKTEQKTSTYTTATPVQRGVRTFYSSNPVEGSPGYYDYPVIGWDFDQIPVQGETQEVAMALKVTSANKSSGGSVKSSGSAPLRSNGGSATPKKSSSGGGGGSKAKEIKHADKKSDSEKERYHTLKNQLEDLSAAYDRVSKAADRAFGKDKLKLIDGEIKATDDLIKKQEEYIDAIKQNLPTDKAIMDAYAQKVLGFGIQYDQSGNISNYDALQDAMWSVYNARADAMDSESTEWQAFEKEFEELQHWIEQYEETYDLLRDEQDKLQDYLDQQADLQLKKIQYAIELKLNVADDSLAILNYQLNQLEDKAFSAAEAIALMGSKVDVLYDKVAADREGLDRILGQQLSSAEIHQIYEGDMSVLQGKHFTADQIDAIKEYRDDLLSLNEELLEVRRSVQDKVMETFDEFNEKIEDQIDLFDHYNAILENYKNIIDIVGRSYLKVDKELMKTLNQATINNAINKVKGTKDAYDALVVSQKEAEEALQKAIARGNEIDIAAWEEDLEEIQKKVNDAQENMMQAWEDALQSCAEMFELAVEDAIDNFNKAMLPFGSLEEFQDAYDKQKEIADQYLDDYDKIYELSKLARNVNNSINDAPNIAGKQKLAKLLEKINGYQEDGVQMSEYELEYLQKEYDLRLAEIALEEAQNAKSIVRLTRDNEGNYSYSYTADTSAVDDAAQKYEDALHAMQELSSNYIDEMSDQLIDATQQMEEELAAVRVQDYASIEDYYKKIDEIQQYWLDRMGYMQGEFQKALDNNKTLYEEDWKRYADATGYKISADEDFAKSYQDTVLGKLFDSEDDIIDFQQRVNDALGDSDKGLIGELLAAYIQWQENTENAMVAAGTSTEGFAEHMEEAVSGPSGIVDQSNAATESVENMTNQMIAGFTSIIGAVDQWQAHYSKTMDDIIAKNMSVIEAHNLLVKALSTGDSTTSTAGTQTTSTSSGSGGTGGTTGTGSGGTGGVAGTSTGSGSSGSLSVGSYVDVKSGTKWYADSHGGAPWGWARSGTIQYTADGAPLAYNIEGLGWIRKSDIVGYGTGGYTGEWGPAGRLAMLHEKEVVLNAEDSANFLSAIEMVRDLSRYIDLQAQWQSTGLGALVASAIKETDNTLQQQVSISADFPNVSDRNEIEAAFNSLINTAAQYANRKNPLSGIV